MGIPNDISEIVDEIIGAAASVEVEPSVYPYLGVLVAEMATARGCAARPELGLQIRGRLANAYCWATVSGYTVDLGSMIAYQTGSIAGYFPSPVLQSGFDGEHTRIDLETHEGRENTDMAVRVIETYREGGASAAWSLYDVAERTEKNIFSILQLLRDKFATRTKCCRCGSRAEAHCSRCRSEAYCSRACQLARWQGVHRFHCVAIALRLERPEHAAGR